MAKFEQMTDEQLICRLRDGDKTVIDYVMEKYKNLVRKEANAMYLLGGENDDLIQEGMIGLFKAVQDYDVRRHFTVLQNSALPVRCIRPSRHPNGKNTVL